MAESIGTAASVVALALFAFQTCKKLHEVVDSYKNHHPTVKELQAELASTSDLILFIYNEAQPPEQAQRFVHLCKPINGCVMACHDLQKMLDDCTSLEKGGRNKLAAWVKMEYNGKKVVEYKQRIAGYKATLNLALNSFQIHDHATTQEELRSLTQSIEVTHEGFKDQIEDLAESMETANVSTRAALEADRAILQGCLECLEKAQKAAEGARANIIIERNEGGKDSKTLFGTDAKDSNLNLNVVGNKAGDGARMVAGMHDTEVLLQFLRNENAHVIAQTFQTLQAHPTAANLLPEQNIVNGQMIENVPRISQVPSSGGFLPSEPEGPVDTAFLPAPASTTEDADRVPLSR